MRPHNSGHWSIDGAVTSQFEQHLRAVLDLPLGDPSAREPWTVMGNVLGGDYPELYPAYRHLLARDPGLKMHLYGKGVRPGRKIGHVNVSGDDLERAARPRAARHRLPAGSGHRMSAPVVGLVMGSDSDWPVMEAAAVALDEFGIGYEADVVSAHRMPQEMVAYGESASARGLRVVIAGAGGAAHLPGMLAAVTPLPVIGVPVPLKHLDGMDSLLSIVQMPGGVPVATVSIGGARNAGLLAARILASGVDEEAAALRARMVAFQQALRDEAHAKGERLRSRTGGATGAPAPRD